MMNFNPALLGPCFQYPPSQQITAAAIPKPFLAANAMRVAFLYSNSANFQAFLQPFVANSSSTFGFFVNINATGFLSLEQVGTLVCAPWYIVGNGGIVWVQEVIYVVPKG